MSDIRHSPHRAHRVLAFTSVARHDALRELHCRGIARVRPGARWWVWSPAQGSPWVVSSVGAERIAFR